MVEALALRQAAAKAGVLFIVNDRCDLAMAVDADGVHLGQGDLPPRLGEEGDGSGQADRDLHAQSRPGPGVLPPENRTILALVPSSQPGSKQDHDPVVGLEGLRAIARAHVAARLCDWWHSDRPGREVMRAGANGVAVISAILKAPDISYAVNAFLAQMPGPTSPAVVIGAVPARRTRPSFQFRFTLGL